MLRTAGWELNPAQRGPIEREILVHLSIDEIIPDQGRVTDASFAMVAAGIRAVGAVNHRQVELHAEPVVDVVAEEYLRDQAVNVFAVVCHRVTARLQRVVIGELFGDAAVQSPTASTLCFRRSIDSAQITSRCPTRAQQT